MGRITEPRHDGGDDQLGQLDIIGAARPSISDPFLPKKIEEGRPDDIRECIGCNLCISRWEIGGPPMICTQNATAGEEYRRGWHPEKFHPAANADKGVLVVGAGPAGMECAMVLGKRDMSAVHLVEADKEIGGCVNWISQLGHSDGQENLARGTARGLGEWKRIVNYRQIQLDKLKNVDVHLGSRLSTQDVLEYGAEIVIVATGCHFATNGLNPATHDVIEGADTSLDWQLTPDEVVTGDKQIGERVLVLENEGYYMGVSIAQKLAGEGKDVTLVTQMGDVANYMEFTLEAPMLHRDLHRLGVKIHPYTMLEKIEPGVCHAFNVWNPAHKEQFEVDTVVLCTQRLSNDELYHELRADKEALEREGVEAVYMIGDASAPRMIPDAIFDGHRLAREIDSPNPAMPLPFIRERRLWGNVSNEDYDSRLLNTPGRNDGRGGQVAADEDRRSRQAGGGPRRGVRPPRGPPGGRPGRDRMGAERVGRLLARGCPAAARGAGRRRGRGGLGRRRGGRGGAARVPRQGRRPRAAGLGRALEGADPSTIAACSRPSSSASPRISCSAACSRATRSRAPPASRLRPTSACRAWRSSRRSTTTPAPARRRSSASSRAGSRVAAREAAGAAHDPDRHQRAALREPARDQAGQGEAARAAGSRRPRARRVRAGSRRGVASRTLAPPDTGGGAEMLSGSPSDVAQRIADIVKERMAG